MRLHRLDIRGFRKLKEVSVLCGDTTFLIGPNNAGKSSVLRALECLLSAVGKINESEWYSEIDPETGECSVAVDNIVIEAEFRNVPVAAAGWRGFKGRVFPCPKDKPADSGLAIHYRKTYSLGKEAKVEMRSRRLTVKEQFAACKTPRDYIDAGADEQQVRDLALALDKPISARDKASLKLIGDLWDEAEEEEWDENPGGIVSVVLSRLPKCLIIPADTAMGNIDQNDGALVKTLNELFNDVRETSANYAEAKRALDALALELDPGDQDSEFGKMMGDLNKVLADVFPGTAIHALTDLSDPKSLKPTFTVTMQSNIRTPANLQGTGMVRAAVFALLRFRQGWLAKRDASADRSLIIGFEEPEIYLHPSAANQMRNCIYELSSASSQIIATTHSPYMIDLSQKPRQVLNKFAPYGEWSSSVAFNVTEAFSALQGNDRDHVKMLLKIDDHVARAFFTKTVVIVEGDTEEIVLREAFRRLSKDHPDAHRRIAQEFEVIKARGKAAIIPLVRYLSAMSIPLVVVHDSDTGVPGAEVMNKPIEDAAAGNKVVPLDNCVEDVLGYEPPTTDKPFRAFKHTQGWGDDWAGVPDALVDVMREVFEGYLPAKANAA